MEGAGPCRYWPAAPRCCVCVKHYSVWGTCLAEPGLASAVFVEDPLPCLVSGMERRAVRCLLRVQDVSPSWS